MNRHSRRRRLFDCSKNNFKNLSFFLFSSYVHVPIFILHSFLLPFLSFSLTMAILLRLYLVVFVDMTFWRLKYQSVEIDRINVGKIAANMIFAKDPYISFFLFNFFLPLYFFILLVSPSLEVVCFISILQFFYCWLMKHDIFMLLEFQHLNNYALTWRIVIDAAHYYKNLMKWQK